MVVERDLLFVRAVSGLPRALDPSIAAHRVERRPPRRDVGRGWPRGIGVGVGALGGVFDRDVRVGASLVSVGLTASVGIG